MSEVLTKITGEEIKKYRFTVEDYHRMGEVGIIGEDQRVELIQGEIIEMSPINSPHAGTINLLNGLFSKLAGHEFIVSVQNPVQLDDYSEPEPDLAILKYRKDRYFNSHPKPDDVLLLIEVADTSLDKDRHLKLPLYAAAGIPEVWIVNLPERQIEVYQEPTDKGYSQIRIYRNDEVIRTKVAEGVAVNAVFLSPE